MHTWHSLLSEHIEPYYYEDYHNNAHEGQHCTTTKDSNNDTCMYMWIRTRCPAQVRNARNTIKGSLHIIAGFYNKKYFTIACTESTMKSITAIDKPYSGQNHT